ncbi:hypothetical protein D1BOALGB6SA_2914 [Olavius sp. associated proteobacterium Delta 1]|nr:hypothetical protein D1BOALGB6SA_2914 [Olavius sp. associated proteobacterium Delta 1]
MIFLINSVNQKNKFKFIPLFYPTFHHSSRRLKKNPSFG